MARVLYVLGDGIGNIAHGLPTVEAIKAAGHDLTISVVSAWPDAGQIIDHDQVVTADVPMEGFDYVFASPTIAWVVKGDVRPYVNVPCPPHALAEVTEVDANFWIARQLGYEGPMLPGRPKHADISPIEGDYIVIAPGFQKRNDDWLKKRFPNWREVAQLLFDNLRESDSPSLSNNTAKSGPEAASGPELGSPASGGDAS